MELAFILAVPLASIAAPANEVKTLRPEIEQLNQTVAEKFEAAADRLSLSSAPQCPLPARRC